MTEQPWRKERPTLSLSLSDRSIDHLSANDDSSEDRQRGKAAKPPSYRVFIREESLASAAAGSWIVSVLLASHYARPPVAGRARGTAKNKLGVSQVSLRSLPTRNVKKFKLPPRCTFGRRENNYSLFPRTWGETPRGMRRFAEPRIRAALINFNDRAARWRGLVRDRGFHGAPTSLRISVLPSRPLVRAENALLRTYPGLRYHKKKEREEKIMLVIGYDRLFSTSDEIK